MKKSLLGLSIAALFANQAMAFEEVDAKSLVGHVNGGIHFTRFLADDDRSVNQGAGNAFLDSGRGFGGEVGYRLSEANEIRLQYTDLSIDTNPNLYGDVDGSAFGADILHFPTQKNLYLLAGGRQLDLDDDALSLNAGVGYRHYFSSRIAAYAEAKWHYQFEQRQKDFSTSIGLMYFFGSNAAKPAMANNTVVPTNAATKVSHVDTDKDGVIDSKDKCLSTPYQDKVDANGCTVFANESATMELHINFDNNKADIKPNYLAEVERAVAFMNTYKHVSLVIEGHTSAQGSAQYNKALSSKRAQAVVDLMVNQYNVDASRLSAVGYGEEKLLNMSNSSQAHAENRRIEAKVSVTKKVAVKK